MSKRSNQRGFTLIEIMVVLVIGIIVIAVAAGGIGRAFSSNEATTETRNINDLMANIQTLKGQNGYSDISMELLARVDGIPTSLTNSDTGDEVRNSWNGVVDVSGDANSFTISYAGVPESACIQLATKIAEAGAMSVEANEQTVLDAANAADQCSSGNNNGLNFTYGVAVSD